MGTILFLIRPLLVPLEDLSTIVILIPVGVLIYVSIVIHLHTIVQEE